MSVISANPGLCLKHVCGLVRKEFKLRNTDRTFHLSVVPVIDTACLLLQVICKCPQEFNCAPSLGRELQG